MSGRKAIFVFVNFPTGGKPYVDKIYQSTPYLEQMYQRLKQDGNTYMPKRDLERCGIMFPAGPRYMMLPYYLLDNFPNTYAPSGPDLFDVAHERYMREQKEKREANRVKEKTPDME